jgi:hypothetical protein
MVNCPKPVKNVIRLWFVLLLIVAGARAQSLDPSSPAPVRSNSFLGRIAARDLGDSRLTDHYYAFTGTPGDLLITVQSKNLNGDIDIFTAGTLRPLLKLTVYAESTSPVTKGIYLRRREDLILRVEARSPNDDEGTYQLTFTGSFEPIAGGVDVGETEATALGTASPATGSGTKTRRVSSVGARIEEPAAEIAATPTPEPTPEAKPTERTNTAEKPAESSSKAAPPRAARPRRPTTRRVTPAPGKPVEPVAEEKQIEEDEAKVATSEPKPKPPSRTGTRRRGATPGTTKPKAEPAATQPQPDLGPRLVIETNDGTLINRSMSGVRRVMVENGQVVVVGRDGKVDRFLLANVVRMSIAP